MKKIVFMAVLLTLSFSYLSYIAYARGGESFFGGFAGGTVGSLIGSSASKSSGGGDSQALRAVDKLENMVRSDLTNLNAKISNIEKRMEDKMDAIERRVDRLEEK